MKIVFISSDVSQSDVLVNSFLDGIDYKITNQISLQDIPEDATHVTFIYHESDFFPFVLKAKYELFVQIHELSFNMILDEESDDLSYVKVYDNNNGELLEAYYVNKQNTQLQSYHRYPYKPDYHFISDDYIEKGNSYSELDSYNCDISSDYFNDMMYFFNELQKRNKHLVIDFLTCNFVASTIQDIESHFPNLVMRVSTNDTGNPEYGGDWIMEYTSDATETANVKDVYFNDHISHFSVILSTIKYHTIIQSDVNNSNLGNIIINLGDPITENTSGVKLKNASMSYIDYMLIRYEKYITSNPNALNVDDKWYFDAIYGSKPYDSNRPKRTFFTTIVIPKKTQFFDYLSGFADHDNKNRDARTNGVTEVIFETRNSTDGICYVGPSAFRRHITLEKITIDTPYVNFHLYDRDSDSNTSTTGVYYSGYTFRRMPELTTLVLTGSDLTFFPQKGAEYCYNLEEVELGSTIKDIKFRAFHDCTSLTTINLENVETIGSYAFEGCTSLTSVDLTSLQENIGFFMFKDLTSLQSVTLGNNTSIISDNAFEGCTSLTTINLNNIEKILDYAFKNCSNLTTINLNSINEINEYAFNYCIGLTSVTLGSNPTIINRFAFSNCTSLTTINLENVQHIYGSAFNYCTSLTSADLSNILDISSIAFFNCTSLTSVTLGSNLKRIYTQTFKSCTNLTTINLNYVEQIDSNAFAFCSSLIDVSLESVTNIEFEAFTNCSNITTIHLDSIEEINDYAFSNCSSLSLVTLGTGLTSITREAFGTNSTINTFVFPIGFDWSNNTNISSDSFGVSNTDIPELNTAATITNLYYDSSFGTIPSNSSFNGGTVVNAIGYEIFGDYILITQDVSLTEINGKLIVNGTSSLNYIIRSHGHKEEYNTETTITSSTFTDIQPGDTLVLNAATTIANDAFTNNSNISSVQFSSSLTSIGKRAFKLCTGLTNLDLSNCTSLDTIDEDAFRECRNLTNVNFSGCTSLDTIRRGFYLCNLSSINLEDTPLTVINGNVFQNSNQSISSIILPKPLLKLNYFSFVSTTTTLNELFLPPDISFVNTSGSSFIAENALRNISITNLYYNSANGSINSGNNWPTSANPIPIANALGYTIDGSDMILDTTSYNGSSSSGRTIWGYNITESTDIVLSTNRNQYVIDLQNVTTSTTFTFSRSNTNHLLRVEFSSSSIVDISYTNSITNQSQVLSSNNIKSKIFNSDLVITLDNSNGLRTDIITIKNIHYFQGLAHVNNDNDNIECYNIEDRNLPGGTKKMTCSGTIQDITFIDCSINKFNFGNNNISGLRFTGSFSFPTVENANITSLNSLYHKYSIVNNKLYNNFIFTIQDVSINRDFSDNYGSDHNFNIASKRYLINGIETPELQLIAGESYDCVFPDGNFGIFGDISNTTDTNGLNENIFGGTVSSLNHFTINSSSIDVSINASGKYYYGHELISGMGGLNTNISIQSSVTGSSLKSTISDHSTLLTYYKVKEYPDILNHIYNHTSDGEGRILQIPNSENTNGKNKGYINGYYNPKLNIKSGSDIILEIPNIVYDSTTNTVTGTDTISLDIYKTSYDSNNTFDTISQNSNIILDSPDISLQYVKLRLENTDQYYIKHDTIEFINVDVSDTVTETISFEQFGFDIQLGSITSPISKVDEISFLNSINFYSNNVNSSLSNLYDLSYNVSPKIRFTIESQYTDDVLLTFLFYFKKIEYYESYLKTISTPYFSSSSESLPLNPLQTSSPFRAYVGSFIVTIGKITKSIPIYLNINEISKSDLDNLVSTIRITGGLQTEDKIKDMLVSKFDVNTRIENNDNSSIIELFLKQQMNRNLSKISTTNEKQTINILGKPRMISTFFNTDEPVFISSLTNNFQNNTIFSNTYKSMQFGHSIYGPTQLFIPNENDNIRGFLSHNKLFIINHTIRKFINTSSGNEINFDTFISNRMNSTTQNDVDISINYYNEYKYPRREFDVTISGGKFEISYTSGSQYNSDVSGTSLTPLTKYTGSALDENGNLNCNENEIYIFNQTHSTNVDSNGVLDHALTIYPVDPSGNPIKNANVNCIPTLGGPLTKTRIFHCFKPKFFSDQMDTTKYYFGSIREASDISFGEWWMNDLYDGNNINIIVDVDNYESPSSFRFLKNHIRSIPSSKIKQFNDIIGNSHTVNDILSIKLKYSGDTISTTTSSLNFHFDLIFETINMSSDTTLGISILSHITINNHHISSSDIESITIEYNSNSQEIQLSDIESIVIDSTISDSNISVNEFDFKQLYIDVLKTYVFKPSSFYLNSDLSRSFIAVDDSNGSETVLSNTNISMNNTTSIQFKQNGVNQGTFGSDYNSTNDWSFLDTSMGAFINILPAIPIGDSTGISTNINSDIIKSRNAWEVGRGIGSSVHVENNQELYSMSENSETYYIYN